MRNILLLVGAVALVACVGITDPDHRSPYCWYAGDTVALIGPVRDASGTMRCVWAVADHKSCFMDRVGLMTLDDCVIPAESDD